MHRWASAILLLSVCLSGQNKPQANYSISARLNPTAKTVTGRETLTWINRSQDPIPDLQLHLYMNAFKNTKSTFMRESGGQLRGDRFQKDSWGYIDIKKLAVADGADLTRAMEFIAPDDGNAEDRTVIRVPLEKPVPPGGQITLEIDFVTQFPHVFARTGYHGNFFLGGQWFPKIGVWEKAGMRFAKSAGWNCHQFHANSEFYADYGAYGVDLTVPSEYVVGATGIQKNAVKNGDGTTTYRFEQANVHDFAWTAQPTYRRFTRTFDAEREVTAKELTDISRLLGIPHAEARLSNVEMILLLQPEHAGQAERHFRATANAIKWFGLWYGAYPHATITVVDPPNGGGGAGGMEYPTFITAGTTWLQGRNDGDPEGVVVHEFGHQYWQGLVGSNEFEEAWMDEGFNTYSTGKVIDRAYPGWTLPLRMAGIPLSNLMRLPALTWESVDRAAYLSAPKADDLARRAWEYQTGSSYSLNSYMRPGAMMLTLENTLGEAEMAKAMRAYHQRWRYDHPAFPDFIAAVNESTGKDMNWFFDQFVYSSNVADYAVAGVSCEPVSEDVGVFDGNGGRRTVTAAEARKIDEEREKNHKRQWLTKATIRREGEAVYPVDIEFRFENGETERRQWDGKYRWAKFEFTKPTKVASVAVDPEHKLVLDANWTNNSWRAESSYATAGKLTSTVLFWVEQVLATLALLA